MEQFEWPALACAGGETGTWLRMMSLLPASSVQSHGTEWGAAPVTYRCMCVQLQLHVCERPFQFCGFESLKVAVRAREHICVCVCECVCARCACEGKCACMCGSQTGSNWGPLSAAK